VSSASHHRRRGGLHRTGEARSRGVRPAPDRLRTGFPPLHAAWRRASFPFGRFGSPKVGARGPVPARPHGARRRQAGYLLVAAMALVAVTSILAAKAAQDTATIHRRDMEEELKFRGERIVRAIIDWKRANPNGQWPTLEILAKPPRRFLHAIPPDPMTAKFDERGKLVEKSGQWQPIFLGATTPPPQGGRRPPNVMTITPLPCDQKMPGWEKNRPIVGVYSCAEGKALTMYAGKEGLTYREWLFSAVPPGGSINANITPGMLLPTLVKCPGQECLLSAN